MQISKVTRDSDLALLGSPFCIRECRQHTRVAPGIICCEDEDGEKVPRFRTDYSPASALCACNGIPRACVRISKADPRV